MEVRRKAAFWPAFLVFRICAALNMQRFNYAMFPEVVKGWIYKKFNFIDHLFPLLAR